MVKRHTQDPLRTRSSFIAAFFVIGFSAIILRLGDLQLVNGTANRAKAEQQRNMVQKLSPTRGEIDLVDTSTRQLVPVATNIEKPLVYVVPQEIQNSALTAASLASVLGLDAADIQSKLDNKEKKYVILKKQLTDEEKSKILDLHLSGVYFDNEGFRLYPQGSLLSRFWVLWATKAIRARGCTAWKAILTMSWRARPASSSRRATQAAPGFLAATGK